MNGEYILWNGVVTAPSELAIPLPGLLAAHYVYQRIHAFGGQPLHLDTHLDLAARAFRHIYGIQPEFDEKAVADDVAGLLRTNRYPPHGSATVLLCVFPRGDDFDTMAVCERPLLEQGYSVSSLRPVAVSYEYSIPYSAFPTGFQLSAANLYDTLALEHGATRSVRRVGDRLISCGGSPLFGIKGKTLFTAPLTEGAVDSLERRMIISAAAKSKMDFLEEAVPHSELRDFDELFYADAAGITSFSECDGAKFMSLLVSRLIDK